MILDFFRLDEGGHGHRGTEGAGPGYRRRPAEAAPILRVGPDPHAQKKAVLAWAKFPVHICGPGGTRALPDTFPDGGCHGRWNPRKQRGIIRRPMCSSSRRRTGRRDERQPRSLFFLSQEARGNAEAGREERSSTSPPCFRSGGTGSRRTRQQKRRGRPDKAQATNCRPTHPGKPMRRIPWLPINLRAPEGPGESREILSRIPQAGGTPDDLRERRYFLASLLQYSRLYCAVDGGGFTVNFRNRKRTAARAEIFYCGESVSDVRKKELPPGRRRADIKLSMLPASQPGDQGNAHAGTGQEKLSSGCARSHRGSDINLSRYETSGKNIQDHGHEFSGESGPRAGVQASASATAWRSTRSPARPHATPVSIGPLQCVREPRGVRVHRHGRLPSTSLFRENLYKIPSGWSLRASPVEPSP